MESLAGQLLVASPQLADPNFARTLVLLVQHSPEGAFGVVVNRPLPKTVQEVWREVGSSPCHCRQPIYLGGPVPGPILSLHDQPQWAEIEPVPGLFFSARKQHLDELVLAEEASHKVFIGHSGWGAGQLENEIRQGDWRTTPATTEIVFATQDNLWEFVFRQMGHDILKSMLHIKDLPSDPTVN
jgi:putative transcriptional regulator